MNIDQIKKEIVKSIIIVLLYYCCFASEVNVLIAQTKLSPKQIANVIAHRVISETSLEMKLIPQEPLPDIQVVDFGSLFGGSSNQIAYAHSIIRVVKDTVLHFGLSSDLPFQIFINNKLVFECSKARPFIFKESGYELYTFNDTTSFNLIKGENHILIKGMISEKKNVIYLHELIYPGKVFSAGFLKSFDEKAKVNSFWLYNGPYFSDGNNPLNKNFEPEYGWKNFYSTDQGIMNWKMPPTNLINEIVINPKATFKRESYAEWTYPNGTVLLSLLSLSDVTGDSVYSTFVKKIMSFTLSNLPLFRKQYEDLHALRSINYRIMRCGMLDDCGSPALPYLQEWINTNNNSYEEIVRKIASYITNGQTRLKDETLCRLEDKPMTIWADDLFMSVPFLLRMGIKTGEISYYNDAAKQIINFNKYLKDKSSGLYHHAYYDFKKEQSPVLWGRANGWVIWAESEALLHLPQKHPDYSKIGKIFKEHMEAILKYQEKSGLWHQVLDHKDSFEESSCTAMFIIGMIRGMRIGILDKNCTSVVRKAWEGLKSRITDDGIVKDICRGTGISDSFDFYYKRERFENDPRGLGAVITASIEMMSLEK